MTAPPLIRTVGGVVRALDVVEDRAEDLRIEFIRRDTDTFMRWHFRNPRTVLFWHRGGARVLRASICGRPVEQAFQGPDRFAFYPAGVEIDGEWITGRRADYAVVFLPDAMVRDILPGPLPGPALAFRDDWLAESLTRLGAEREAGRGGGGSGWTTGWAAEALTRLRASIGATVGPGGARGTDPGPPPQAGGAAARPAPWDGRPPTMTRPQIKRVLAHMDDNLSEKLSTDQLARVAGLSRRHFGRVFRMTFGAAPHQFLISRRIERAAALLTDTERAVSDIALETGFGNPQHFAAAFRAATGLTASEARARLRAGQRLRGLP